MNEMYPEEPLARSESTPTDQPMSVYEIVEILDANPVTRELGQAIVADLVWVANALGNAVTVLLRTPLEDLPDEVKNLPGFMKQHAEYNAQREVAPLSESTESEYQRNDSVLAPKESRIARLVGAFRLGRKADKTEDR